MAGPLIQALLLIVNSVVGFFSILLLARFFLQMRRVPFNTPAASFVLKLTNWLVLPLRKAIPPVFGLDSASLIGAYLLQILALSVLLLLQSRLVPPSPAEIAIFILLQGILSVLRLCVYLFIGLLVAQAILSWVNPYSPLSRPIVAMTDPLLRPLRRFIPPIANVDLTPLIAILAAQVVLLFL